MMMGDRGSRFGMVHAKWRLAKHKYIYMRMGEKHRIWHEEENVSPDDECCMY